MIKLMTWIIVLVIVIVILSSGVGLLLFRFESPNNFERTIITKIRQETPYLANFETMYSLVFTNFRDNWIFSDDFYIRHDQANVFYGYALKDATIKLKREDRKNMLWVQLPDPKQISIDRKIVSIESRHEDYQPIDGQKQPINVDKWMVQHLNSALEMYEEKSIAMTREMS